MKSLLSGAAALVLLAPAAAGALPVGPTVVSGSASFLSDGALLEIAALPGTVLDWEAFAIGPGETVRFVQPEGSAAVLNRVSGASPVVLSGALVSNGAIALVSPFGLTLDAGARSAGLFMSIGSSAPLYLAGPPLTDFGSVALAAPGAHLVSGSAGPAAHRAGLAYESVAPGGSIALAFGHAGDPSIVTLASSEPGVGATLTATPLPAAGWLLLTGLLGLMAAARRTREAG